MTANSSVHDNRRDGLAITGEKNGRLIDGRKEETRLTSERARRHVSDISRKIKHISRKPNEPDIRVQVVDH